MSGHTHDLLRGLLRSQEYKTHWVHATATMIRAIKLLPGERESKTRTNIFTSPGLKKCNY